MSPRYFPRPVVLALAAIACALLLRPAPAAPQGPAAAQRGGEIRGVVFGYLEQIPARPRIHKRLETLWRPSVPAKSPPGVRGLSPLAKA